MSIPNVSTPMNPVIEQRQQLLSQKEHLMKEELLLDEYDKTQTAYQAMNDAAQVFEQKKAEYLQEEAQYEALGNSINMSATSPTTPSNPTGFTPSPAGVPSPSPNASVATGTPPIEASYNPNAAAAYYNPDTAQTASLPGEGLPYYQPLPSTSSTTTPPNGNAGVPSPPTAQAQGVPTQANLQQQAQQAPVTPEDIAALRQILQMNPQTAQQASKVSDADLTQLLKSDPEIASAVKEFEAMSAQGGTATAKTGPASTPTDPAQALKLAQQDPEVMKQAQAMVASLSPQEREAMMKQMANDPEAQAILAQMGVSLPKQGTPAPTAAPKQKA